MRAWGVVLAAGLVASSAAAGVRVQRMLDWRSGLPTSYSDQVEQDPEGFLWITTIAGVVRYDGTEARPVTGPLTRFIPGSVAYGHPLIQTPGDDGMARIMELDGTLVSGGDGGRAFRGIVADDGALWTLLDGAMRRREGDRWSDRVRAPGGAALTRGPFPGRNGAILIGTDREIYRMGPDLTMSVVARLSGAVTGIEHADGSVYLGCWLSDGGHIYHVTHGVAREIQHTRGRRLIHMAMRGDVLWIAYDALLVRVAPGEEPDIIESKQGLEAGGALFVDREGSLWVGSQNGLVQFPEPEAFSFSDTFRSSGRCMTPAPEGFWFASWSGALHGIRSESGWKIEHREEPHVNAACVAPDGTVWAAVPGGFRGFDGPGPARMVLAGDTAIGDDCASDAAGGLWFPTSDGLFHLDPADKQPERVRGLDGYLRAVAIDGDGAPWAARGSEVCHRDREIWTCEKVEPRADVTSLRVMPSGDIWAGTVGAGVFRRRAGRWEPIPGSKGLASAWVTRLNPSPSGGTWIAGEGILVRVLEQPERPDGWEIVERVGVWQGLPNSMVNDMLEDQDGALWLATHLSLVKIPPVARFARPAPPTVAAVELSVDGRRLDPKRPIELPYRRNRLELRFAALSFREPALVRYRVRLRPGEPWSAPTPHPTFRFVDLASGSYRVEIQASLDGAQWSASARPLEVEVFLPWWRTGWFYLAAALASAAALTIAYRIRIGQLLRLERQRTRIAMDLHDAIGSGLGSIRILAGLAERATTPDGTRAQISSRISAVADELAQSLSDIVGTLRPGTATLSSLGAQLVARAGPLFVGRDIALEIRPVEPWPEARLSLAVRRHVFLIGAEALHNAARHAEAHRVVLSLAREGRRWRLTVEDDGRGMEASPPKIPSRGLGLESIARRAAEIGAAARWEPRPGGGTVFSVSFDGLAEDRRTHAGAPSHERATGAPGPDVTHSPPEEVSS